jgi:serine/threonine protein kinase
VNYYLSLGFRYLIMEQMAAPFETVVSDIASGKRHFGQVASHLLHIIQQVHAQSLLVIDIKPDNFMIDARGNIVMIDLGLIQSYKSIGGHRANTESASVVGTPLYASLHMFDGNTPSRRDDLEALCYLLMEVTLQVGSKEDLPWSHGKSEDDIGTLKRSAMSSAAIWKQLATSSNAAVAKALHAFFNGAHAMGYTQLPDYETLGSILKDMTLSKNKKPPAASRRTAASRGGATTSTRAARGSPKTAPVATASRSSSSAARSSRAQKRPSPVKAAGRKAKRQEVIDVDADEDDFHSVVELDQIFDDDDFHTCPDDDVEMEWEDEEEDAKPRATKNSVGVTLKVIAGPHQGESISLIQHQNETVVFGVRPDVKNGYDLAGDSEVDLQHASLQLHVQNKKLVTVLVKDLKSNSGTYANKILLVANRVQKVFMSDIVSIGDTQIKVCPLVVPPPTKERAPRVQMSNLPDVEMRAMDLDDSEEASVEEEANVKENRTPGVLFAGTKHEFVLTSSPLVVGSDPRAASVVIPGIAATACELTLNVSSRQLLTVSVKAPSSGGDVVSINGNAIRREGKLFLGDTLAVGGVSWKVSPNKTTATKSASTTESKASNVASSSPKIQKKTTTKAAAAPRRGMVLLFTEGPYKGERIEMHEGDKDNLVMGANPHPRPGDSFRLAEDGSITDASHVRLELNTNKKGFCTMTVTDLKSSGGTSINSLSVGKGKKQTAFCGDVIALGTSTSVKLQPL